MQVEHGELGNPSQFLDPVLALDEQPNLVRIERVP